MTFNFQRERELGDMAFLMASEQGRRFVYGLIQRAGVSSQTFAVDPYITAFNEGQRSQGLAVLADLMAASPDQYLTMINEAKALEARDAELIAKEKEHESTDA